MIDEDIQKTASYGQFDRIAWPGATKDLEAVKNSAGISIKLHDPDKITIYEHEDCGAYKEDNSTQTHLKNAQALKEELKKIKPSLEVTLKMATFDRIKELQST